jgi:F-box protein 21
VCDHLYSVEDESLRYVAEENVELALPQLAELPPTLLKVAGKYFKRFDHEAHKFVSNLGEEFPED